MTPGATGAGAPPRYRADIDGLRAVAVLLVVLFHAFPKAVPGGYIGVDVFFVISGYLITGIIEREIAERRYSFANFYARRFRRILPALFVVLVAAMLLGGRFLLPDEYGNLGAHLAAAAGFVSNVVLFQETGYFSAVAEEKPLLHLWSLAIEEQFYLVWPVVLVAATHWRMSRGATVAALGVASLILNIWLVDASEKADIAFYFLPTRFWELAAGGILAIQEPQLRRWLDRPRRRDAAAFLPAIGLALLTVAAFRFGRTTPFPGWHATIPVAAAMLVIAGGSTGPRRGFLAAPTMVYVGLISYPLYLWHWPLLAFLRVVETEPGRLAKLLAIVLAFALAAATRRFIEQPVRRIDRFGAPVLPTRAAILGGLCGLAMIGIAGAGIRGGWLVGSDQAQLVKFVDRYRNYNAQSLFRIDKCDVGIRLPEDPLPECITRDPGQPAILVWGDSHAEHLYPGFAGAFPRGVSILQVASSGCMPLLDHPSGRKACDRANQLAIERMRDQRPEVVVIAGLWTDYVGTPQFAAKFDATVAAIHRAGVRRVVVVGGVPQWHPTLYQLLARRRAIGPDAVDRLHNRDLDRVRQADAVLRQRASAGPGFVFVSLVDRLCAGDTCQVRIGAGADADLVAFDYGHLTRTASEHVVGKYVVPALGLDDR